MMVHQWAVMKVVMMVGKMVDEKAALLAEKRVVMMVRQWAVMKVVQMAGKKVVQMAGKKVGKMVDEKAAVWAG